MVRFRRLLIMPFATAGLLTCCGCASNGWGRPRALMGARTMTSVGDTPNSVVAGTPGRSHSSGPLFVEPRTRAEGRVSGRVVDNQGRPVANAEVRLADGGSATGRTVRTLTDDAGGFTLSSLRPGQHYTLVAYGDRNGKELTGREVVEAPDSQVEIALREADEVRTVSRGTPTRRIADRADFEDKLDELDGVNHDDLPATHTRQVSESDEPARRGTGTADPWHSAGEGDSHRDEAASLDPNHPSTVDTETMNPLPPALERREGTADRAIAAPARDDETARTTSPESSTPNKPGEPFTSGEGPLTSSFDASSAAPASQPQSPALDPTTPTGVDNGPFPNRGEIVPPSNPEPAQTNDSSAPGPELYLPNTPAPAVSAPANTPLPSDGTKTAESESATHDEPETLRSEPVSVLAQPVEASPRTESHEADEEVPANSIDHAAKSTGRRPTWRELTAQSEKKPPEVASPISVRRGPTAEDRKALASQSAPKRPRNIAPSNCRYDARTRRIVDFQLSDLNGAPMRFSDIDADYILLDFWGTWCGPCLKSIPHLVELQGRYDPKRVRVVGIAYETGSPDSRADLVHRTAEQLRVNYPLLLAEADGKPCPLAAALHVQAYPTMILVDRHGRILWRDSGSSDTMLSRLDRVIAANARGTGDTVIR